jgi:hypothetical protein
MDQNDMVFDAGQRPRPPRREFVATIGTEELGRYAGVGLTLEQVIAEELRKVGCAGVSAGPVEARDDVVLWEANKVAALVRIGPDGQPVVTRFNQSQGPSDGPEPQRATAAAPSGASGGGPLCLTLAGEVRGGLVLVDLENLAQLDLIRRSIAGILAKTFHPKKSRPRRAAVSRRPGPRRKPGWGLL